MFLAVMLKPSAALQKEGIEGRAVMSVSSASIRFNVQKLSFLQNYAAFKGSVHNIGTAVMCKRWCEF